MLREYCFICNCGEQFSIFCEMQDIVGYMPQCPKCKTNEYVYRNWSAENIHVADILNGSPRTVGALADMNMRKGLNNDKLKEEKNQEISYTIKKINDKKGRAERIKK